jgi:Ca2+:H+ antiporter
MAPTRALLWSSLLLVPADIVADLLGAGGTALFVLSALALVPLAYVIGEATEQAGEHTGPALAGLLNASFGNAPELIISLFAVDRGLFDFVRGSLTGSVVSNLLLVLGATLLASRGGSLNGRTGAVALVETALAAAAFVIPAAAHHFDADNSGFHAAASLPVAVVLLVGYVVVTARGIVRQRREHRDRRPAPTEGAWSLPKAMAVLAVAAAATAFVSEVLTGSVQDFTKTAGLPEFFVAAVIVALVGNAAEHGGAIVIAARGNVELAAEIPFSSSAQVALLVIPAVVLLSLAMHPLPLAFRPVELVSMAVAVAVPALVLLRRRADRWAGGALCLSYVAVAAGYYVAAA